MLTIIKNGTIVTATDKFKADIKIDGEKIVEISDKIDTNSSDNIIDATDRYIFPGGIDAHTHLDMPFMGTMSADDFNTGSKAAICGGTTTFIDFVTPKKGNSLKSGLEEWKEKAKKTNCDYSFHMIIVEYNDKIEKEIPKIIKEEGVPSFKCFLAYKNVLQIDDGQLISVLKTVGENGGMVSVHAENGDMIVDKIKQFKKEGKLSPQYHYESHPEIAEEEAIQRAITIAEYSNQPIFIVHLSSEMGLNKIKEAQIKGIPVYAETCPQYLLLDKDLYYQEGFEGAKYVMSPPLRPKEDQKAMWDALEKGFVHTVATDHCPFQYETQKVMGKDDFTKIPNGAAGVGDRFNLLYTYGVAQNRLSLNRFVDVVSTRPAKIFGLYPQKGTIAVGSDADIVIFDPNKKSVISAKTHNHNCDYSIFEGFKLEGEPEMVLLRGELIVKDGKLLNEDRGKFIPRYSCGELNP